MAKIKQIKLPNNTTHDIVDGIDRVYLATAQANGSNYNIIIDTGGKFDVALNKPLKFYFSTRPNYPSAYVDYQLFKIDGVFYSSQVHAVIPGRQDTDRIDLKNFFRAGVVYEVFFPSQNGTAYIINQMDGVPSATLSISSTSPSSSAIQLNHGSTYNLSAGGKTVTFTMPSQSQSSSSELAINSYLKIGPNNTVDPMTLCGITGQLVSGSNNKTQGQNSTAFGTYNTAQQNQIAGGWFGKSYAGGYSGAHNSSTLFHLGNGVQGTPNTAFRVAGDGNTYAQKSFNANSADYAEYFEWEDGNPNNEDRRGRFVTLVGEKIRLANEKDTYILGVVSTTACMIGDSQEDDWHGKYLRDVYGATITAPKIVPDAYENGDFIPGGVIEDLVINPRYNPETEYIPRSQRPEWTTIGLLGKIVIDDDGTCVVGGRCKPNADGIATNATEGYYVMSRIDENHIKVLIK